MSTTKEKSVNTAVLGLFSAIVVVLQILSYFVKIGTFNLSLVLIPIVLGAILYGPGTGSILGAVFGVVTAVAAVIGLDAGGQILFQSSPVALVLVCIVKGTAAGAVAGLTAQAVKPKKPYLAAILAALSAPIVNTGIFTAAMFLIFKDTLSAWANGADLVYYVIFGLLGINFVIEFVLNAVMSPAIFTVTKAVKRYTD